MFLFIPTFYFLSVYINHILCDCAGKLRKWSFNGNYIVFDLCWKDELSFSFHSNEIIFENANLHPPFLLNYLNKLVSGKYLDTLMYPKILVELFLYFRPTGHMYLMPTREFKPRSYWWSWCSTAYEEDFGNAERLAHSWSFRVRSFWLILCNGTYIFIT